MADINDIIHRIKTLKAGEEFTYYIGFLGADRARKKNGNMTPHALEADIIGDAAWERMLPLACNTFDPLDGCALRASLTQRRLEEGKFAYVIKALV